MTETLRDKLIRCGWVTNFNADTLVQLIERHYAALAQPEPQGQQGLIDEELTEFAEEWWRSFQYLEPRMEAATPITDIVHSGHFVDFSHAVLARWGRPAIKPVPVAERLPLPEET